MTFPAVTDTQTSDETSAVTTHNVILPTTIAANNFIIIFAGIDGAPSTTAPTGFTGLLTSAGPFHVFVKKATGSEGGTTVQFSSSASEQSSHISFTGDSWSEVLSEIEISTGATGTSSAPNPDSVTASWGSDDNLFLAPYGASRGDRTISSFPTNYTDNQTSNSNGGASGASVAVATRADITSASDDPGAYALSGNTPWRAATLVIRPAAAGGITGSGALASQDATTSGTAEVVKTGSGSLQSQSSTTTGTAEIVKTSSGALQAQSATTSGTGTVGAVVTGSGALQAQDASTAGTGEIEKTGTGALQSQSATTSGTAEIVKTGTGALQSQDSSTAGTGNVTAGAIGEGDLQSQDATTSGTGSIEKTGTGALQSQNAATSGAGVIEKTGTGALQAQSASTAGGDAAGTADSFYASSGVIRANVLSSVGMIDAGGLASESLITDSFSSSGKINDNTISSTGIIDPDGLASKGDI